MTFRDDMISLKDEVYSDIVGPNGLDQRPYQLSVITRTWTGGKIGAPAATGQTKFNDVPLDLPQDALVRQLTMREIAGVGGRYLAGDIIVEHIRPRNNAGVGFTIDQLKPKPSTDGVQILYVLTGTTHGLSGTYELVEGKFDKPMKYALVLRETRETP